MKATLQSACIGDVEPFLTDGVVDFRAYKQITDEIHKKVVDEAIEGLGPNRVLGNRPPLIDPSETALPRQTRAVLSQLRSGHCAKLQSYLHFIGRAADDLCPSCRAVAHSVDHLFSCPSHPTTLTTTDIWENPWDVATFLATLPSFSGLPDPGPPPPPRPRPRQRRRPPPEPPPTTGTQS